MSVEENMYAKLAREGERVSYSIALNAMKKGFRVAREGWNGKGMWICLGEGQKIGYLDFWNKHTSAFALARYRKFYKNRDHDKGPMDEAAKVEVLPYFIMKTADDCILMGWLASQTDMVADDWIILED